jgi:hypothetical protein
MDSIGVERGNLEGECTADLSEADTTGWTGILSLVSSSVRFIPIEMGLAPPSAAVPVPSSERGQAPKRRAPVPTKP